MKRILLLSFCVSISTAYAQQWLWAYPIKSDQGFNVTNVMTDSLGHGYFTGAFYISKNDTFEGLNTTLPVTQLHSFVAKYDNSGNLIWVSGGRNAFVNGNKGYSVDKSGNTYMTGEIGDTSIFGNGAGTIQNISPPSVGRVFLVKLDENGKAVFLKTQGDTCSPMGKIVTALPTNELIHIGYNQTECPYMGGNAVSYFKKLDATMGKEIWSIPCTPWFAEVDISHVIPTKDNGFVISGRCEWDSIRFDGLSSHIYLPLAGGHNLFFLIKYSSAGEILWWKSASDTNLEWDQGITVDGNNDIIFALETSGVCSFDNITFKAIADRTLHIIKTDASGNYKKSISFNSGAYSHFRLTDLNSDKYGNIYVSAKLDTTLIIGKDTIFYNTNPLSQINVIIKFDSNFNYLWSQYVSGYTNGGGKLAVTDNVIYFAMNHDGIGVTLHGSNYSFPNPGNPKATSFVSAIRNDNSFLTTVPSIPKKMVNVFPNPSSGIFNVNLSSPTIQTKICVYDVFGKCVLSEVTKNTTSCRLDLSGQSRGIYFLEMVSDEERTLKKIVLQ